MTFEDSLRIPEFLKDLGYAAWKKTLVKYAEVTVRPSF